MKVSINGRTVNYISDFDPVNIHDNVKRGWKVSAGDYFKFLLPLKIDGVAIAPCFIKRFNKTSAEISGYDFLVTIRGKRLSGLPMIFDIVHTTEADHVVIYVFQEYIYGNTLDNLQREGFSFLPARLGEDLFYAMKSIHDNGSWFPDFDPKNFVRSDEGNFFIIDLDSTYPLTSLPASSMFGAKDFWAPTYEFYRKKENCTSAEIKKMRGDVLNHLNLIYLLGLYSFYIDEEGKDLTAYSIVHLNEYLPGKHVLFAATMLYCFHRDKATGEMMQRVPSYQVFKSLLDTVLFPDDLERTLSSSPKKPEILFFTVNGQAVHDLEINAGNNIELEWEVKDTTSVRLIPGNRIMATKGVLEISPFEDTSYSLRAVHKYKSKWEEEKRSIDINIYDPDLKKPVIEFGIEGHLNRAILLEEMEYVVKWNVKDAQKVFLDDAKVKLNNNQAYIATKDRVHNLRAINSRNGKSKKAEALIEIKTEKKATVTLSVSPLIIKPGEPVTISWRSDHGREISIIQDGIAIANNQPEKGNIVVMPVKKEDKTFPRTLHFAASAYSLSGTWLSEPQGVYTVAVKKKNNIIWWILLVVIIGLIMFALWRSQQEYN